MEGVKTFRLTLLATVFAFYKELRLLDEAASSYLISAKG